MSHPVEDEDIELSDAPPAVGEQKTEEEVKKPQSQEDFDDDWDDNDIAEINISPEAASKSTSSQILNPPSIKSESKLEDIFDDDDDDFTIGEEEEQKLLADTQATLNQSISMIGIGPSDPGVMLSFYQRLFPFRPLFQWLNHSPTPSNDFAHREFAFTLANDAYLRYQAFPTGDLLRREILRLNPSRFEIGPVYSANPRDRKQLRKAAFRPLEKELVFDIDMTDYDDIRTCCDKAKICHKCWSFVTMAIQVMDVALKEDLGFKHVLWVYSGRRGAHAWVCDKRARRLDDQKRKAVASYLEVVRGGSQSGKKVNVRRPLHPHLVRSLDILKPQFQSRILEDQDPWSSPSNAEKLLRLLPDKPLTDALRKKWDSHPDRPSIDKWSDIIHLAKTNISATLDRKVLNEHLDDIILEYMYPRLDAEVSKHLNHLLKSPFCIHPGTGRVCVPIDVRRVEEFDPLNVPTVVELLEEIYEFDKKKREEDGAGQEGNGEAEKEGGKRIQDYEKTSMKPYVDYFKAFVAGLMREEMGLVKQERAKAGGGESMEF